MWHFSRRLVKLLISHKGSAGFTEQINPLLPRWKKNISPIISIKLWVLRVASRQSGARTLRKLSPWPLQQVSPEISGARRERGGCGPQKERKNQHTHRCFSLSSLANKKVLGVIAGQSMGPIRASGRPECWPAASGAGGGAARRDPAVARSLGGSRACQSVRVCWCLCLRGCERDKNMVQETNGEARPATPDEPKKRSSNLMASAGVNFERRYKSNQSNQNYHVGQSEVSFSLVSSVFSPLSLAGCERAKAVISVCAFRHLIVARRSPLNSHRRRQVKTIGQTLSPLRLNNINALLSAKCSRSRWFIAFCFDFAANTRANNFRENIVLIIVAK